MADDDKIERTVDLIAKLLAKAESTTDEEAAALNEHAQRLMLRYGIQQARLEAAKAGREVKPEEVVTLRFEMPTGHFANPYAVIADEIAAAYGSVRTWHSWVRCGRKRTERTLHIVGFEADAVAVRTLIVSLLLQGRSAMERWWEEERAFGGTRHLSAAGAGKARRDYLAAYGAGAAHKLRDLRRAVHQEEEASAPGTAIMLRDRSVAVSAHMDALKLGKPRAYTYGDIGPAEGYRDGRDANVGGTAIGGQARALEASR